MVFVMPSGAVISISLHREGTNGCPAPTSLPSTAIRRQRVDIGCSTSLSPLPLGYQQYSCTRGSNGGSKSPRAAYRSASSERLSAVSPLLNRSFPTFAAAQSWPVRWFPQAMISGELVRPSESGRRVGFRAASPWSTACCTISTNIADRRAPRLRCHYGRYRDAAPYSRLSA